MCILIDRINNKTVTGYKVAIKKGKKYYSLATGVEYKVGKVIKPRKFKLLSSYFSSHFDNYITKNLRRVQLDRYSLIRINYFGFTSVFKYLRSCKNFCEELKRYGNNINGKEVILEIKLSSDLHTSKFHLFDCYSGKYIESIRELKI